MVTDAPDPTTLPDEGALDPTETARRSARGIGDLPANFMLDMGTYGVAAEFGYEGMGFYYGGRGGVLGDVDAQEVTEAFVFFPAESVQAAWDGSRDVESRAASAQRWADTAAAWAVENLPTDALDWGRLAELAGIVVDAADPAGAPIFEGYRRLDEPTETRGLAVHRLNALRELRAARHGAAVLAADIEPVEALMVKTPFMADVFGWPEPRPQPDEVLTQRWQDAEGETDRAFGNDLAIFDADQRSEFVELVEIARRAVIRY